MTRIIRPSSTPHTRLQRYDWGAMEWLVDDETIADAGISVARMTVEAGGTGEAHRHPNCNEVVHLVSGRVEQIVGDECHVLEPGDTIFIPQGRRHQSRNPETQDAVMIVSYSAGNRVYQKDDPA